MSSKELPYNPKDEYSIIEYAKRLEGTTLRDHVEVNEIADIKRRKGSFGNAVEALYFQYDINSDSNPDFVEVGIEVKTTPLKKNKSGAISSKERLVISMINYMDVVDEVWETSSIRKKLSKILLISYLYEKDTDPLDYPIKIVSLWGPNDEDLEIIQQDWETVVNKVRAGKAHELSGSDTLYLEACTKATDSSKRREQPFSDEQAKPRAWALKSSFMTTVSRGILEDMARITREENEKGLGLLELVKRRFRPYLNFTEDELALRFGYGCEGKRKPKNLTALITKKILGVEQSQRIEEFEKAGIKTKTIRLKRSGTPKEAVSFPTFDYFDVAEMSFDESDFRQQLETKYLFVIYREDEQERNLYRFSKVMFWQMSDEDLEEAERCYNAMAENIRQGRADVSVKSTENRCCHVRPHARNARDTNPTPQGEQVVKKCFWLNASYLAGEIRRESELQS